MMTKVARNKSEFNWHLTKKDQNHLNINQIIFSSFVSMNISSAKMSSVFMNSGNWPYDCDKKKGILILKTRKCLINLRWKCRNRILLNSENLKNESQKSKKNDRSWFSFRDWFRCVLILTAKLTKNAVFHINMKIT